MGTETGLIDHPADGYFELPVEDAAATAHYRVEGNRVVLTHTEVPEQLSGRGVGSRLAREVFEAIRRSGRKAVTRCAFMAAYASRHPEVADVVEQ
jgi:predicted GNAT family acetyltransferase